MNEMWSKWAEFSVQSSNHLNNTLATLVMSVWGTDIIKTHLKMGMNLNLFCEHKRTKWAWGFLDNLITPVKYACKHIDRNWKANVATLKTCFGSLDCTKQHDACLYPSGSGELTIIKKLLLPFFWGQNYCTSVQPINVPKASWQVFVLQGFTLFQPKSKDLW